jgi:UDP-2,4-diacetamido-2,4,6-trideoxy-beta-L-altropyranose hydrolase
MATHDDRSFVWEVNNQPTVRESAVTSEPIEWSDHVEWYDQQLTRSDRVLLIGSWNGTPIGVVRFDIDGDGRDAIITVAMLERYTGRGLGVALIRAASDGLLAADAVSRIVAYVRPMNNRSRRAFERAGFVPRGRASNSGVELIAFQRCRTTASKCATPSSS